MTNSLKRRFAVIALMFSLLVTGVFGAAVVTDHASAGPVEIGRKDGASARLLIRDNETVKRIVYVAAGSKTMVGANTPVASDRVCGNGTLHRADVYLTGTMTGTAPTLAFKWQNSLDGGQTWVDVGTWTTVNATVTPASQSQSVADLAASTATVYGDCWRFTYTFGGSGTVTANFKVVGVEK